MHWVEEPSLRTVGATASAFAGEVVTFGEAWWQPGHRFVAAWGVTGVRGRGTWDAEVVAARRWKSDRPPSRLLSVVARPGTTVSVRWSDPVGAAGSIDYGVRATTALASGEGRATSQPTVVVVDGTWTWWSPDGYEATVTPAWSWTDGLGSGASLQAGLRTAF